MGSDQNLYVTGDEATLVLTSNGEPVEAISLAASPQSPGSITRLSWSSQGFLVGGRGSDADVTVAGYSTSGDTLWQYSEPTLETTRAAFLDNTSFVHAGPAADSDSVLVQRIDTSFL